jgi:ATP-dependent exoDNAse (exonuclease V) beta subunit
MRDIHAYLRIGDPNKPIPEFIKGTIDLIVVDGDGSLHLYDFKTSKHKYRD